MKAPQDHRRYGERGRQWRKVALVVALGLVAPEAAAQDRVDVPARCGSRAEFEQELERLLGPEASQASPYSVTITEAASGDGYVLVSNVRGEHRELGDPDCRTLFRSAVIVAAASVRPDLVSESSEPPATPAPAPEAPARTPPPEPATERNAAPPGAPWRGRVGVGGGGIVGLVPDLAPFVEVAGLADVAGAGALLALRYVALTSADLEGERGVEIRAFGGRAGALYQPVSFFRLGAGLEADLLVGRGTRITRSRSDAAWSLAANLELAAILMEVEGLAIELGLLGRVALIQATFEIEGFGEAYSVPPLGAAGIIRATYAVF